MSGSFMRYCQKHCNAFGSDENCNYCEFEFNEFKAAQQTPLQTQVSGSHYKDLKIQPVEYIHGNGIPFIEGCVIKYVTRWRAKGGVDDLKKARHFLDILIDLETRDE